MKTDLPIILVSRIMRDFAQSTGLQPPSGTPRRYLWTDAFAVCNFLELYRQTGEPSWRDLALRLVDQVHHTLGRHRPEDERSGWISGLSEREGEEHPTGGGLRIGKKLNERRAGEPQSEMLEWDRDGQYYHYLTKWMHALSRVSRVTGEGAYARWACELAQAAHRGFCHLPSPGGGKRLYWKMSVDLSRPQVDSMGQHDPLDGLLTYSELLQGTSGAGDGPVDALAAGVADLAPLCRGGRWGTDDPLGIGGLLFDACRIAQLCVAGNLSLVGLLEHVVDSALAGLQVFTLEGMLEEPAAHRLAFRELGLSIGLHATGKLQKLVQGRPDLFGASDPLCGMVSSLAQFRPIGERIESFWMDDANRDARTWTEHLEINMVMLATSLAPDSFLEI